MDYYSILGVPRDASAEEIRRSYRALSLRLHPDKQSNVTSAQDEPAFASVQKAWEVLRDPQRRAEYDVSLSATRSPLSLRFLLVCNMRIGRVW